MTFLEFGFMQKALVASVMVCAVAPLIGTFVVQRQQSLIGDGMGHVAFAGIGLGYLFGFAPMVGAATISVAAAYVLYRLQRGGLGGDLSLAMIFYGGIALGFLLLSRSGMGINAVVGLLFGSPLNLSWPQVAAIGIVSALVVLLVLALYGPLMAVAFDEHSARVSGVPTNLLLLLLTAAVGLVVVGGMRVMGVLLVAAMMVIPVAAASQVARSYRGTMSLAAALGALSAVAGLLVAFYADYPPGASIVVAAIGCYLVAATVRMLRQQVRHRAAA